MTTRSRLTGAGKKVTAARWLYALGITNSLMLMPKQRCIIVLTYHRIGDADSTPFDPHVFSATAEQFESQVRYLLARFPLLRLADALDFALGRRLLDGPAVLLTFDDGYVDNFEIAYPILRTLRVPATFFLPTAFIETGRIPWWDQLAWYVRRATRSTISVRYPRPATFDLLQTPRDCCLHALLRLYKDPATLEPQRLLEEVAASSGASPPCSSDRLFMNWHNAAEMISGGMDVGSHTHSHDILARLSLAQQEAELRESRELLEGRLKRRIDTLAYPVGGRDTFNSDTYEALRRTGYRAAFSHDKTDVIRPGEVDPYNLLRLSVGPDTPLELVALTVNSSAIAGRRIL